MPGHYTDTTQIAAANQVQAATLKAAIDALDTQLFATTAAGAGGGSTSFRNMLVNSSFEIWERGISAAPDNWVLTGASATLAQEVTLIKHGLYSAKLTRAGTDCNVSQDIYPRNGQTYLRLRNIIFGAWVYATVASRARLRVNDGTTTTYSSYHTGGSGWEFLTVAATVGAAAAAVNVGLQVDTGNTSAYMDGAIVIEGGTLYGYTPEPPVFSQLPSRATMWHDEATVLSGNAIGAVFIASMVYGGYATQANTTSNGDSFSHSFFLAAGTYTLSIFGLTSIASAKVDWYIDNVKQGAGGQDWYSGSAVLNVKKTLTITVVGDGYHVIKGVVNGRNASNTTGFALALTKYWIKPSSD